MRFLTRLARLSVVIAVAGGALACKSTQGERSRVPEADAQEAGAAADSGASEPVYRASEGTPHFAEIAMVRLDPSGQGALTCDAKGGVRLWAALDGSREPMRVPIRDPRSMSLARGPNAGSWVLALVDAAGGARVVDVDADGGMRARASLPPTQPLTNLLVLPGGERLLGVGADHVLRLFDLDGRELARLDQPSLRPAELRVVAGPEPGSEAGGESESGSGSGARVIALTAAEFDEQRERFVVEVLPLELGPESIALGVGREKLLFDMAPTRDNPSLTADGRGLVFVEGRQAKDGAWVVSEVDLETGRRRSVDSRLVSPAQPRVMALPGDRALLDDGTGVGRIVDFAGGRVLLEPLRSNPNLSPLVADAVGSTRIVSMSNWLVVHELEADESLYLGYGQATFNGAGLSPDGRRVAWTTGDRVLVDDLEGAGELFEVPDVELFNAIFVDFIDDETLLFVDWGGAVKLLRWASGEVLDAVDLGTNVVSAEMVMGPEGGVLLVRSGMWTNPVLIEVHAQSFGRRFLVEDRDSMAGVLAPRGQPLERWGVWTYTRASWGLHSFDLEHLRAGVDALAGGEVERAMVDVSRIGMMAVDASGRLLWGSSSGGEATLEIIDGEEDRALSLGTGSVIKLSPDPRGERVAVVLQRSSGAVLSVYDLGKDELRWARPVPATVTSIAWSDEGGRVAVSTAFGGGMVLSVDTGEIVEARCGQRFEARRTAPVNVGLIDELSVCEL
ncbi:hypothetical protein G6O69_16165 [Pseudenhygromyxa sp. WMMC2535]|uniref:hypothetical protein n=1 Tax=Pseudenhygromyxa sp. WMMC2535 TaxID=2712867 RepID=UPI0015564F56|nr:hypothetical protein [Pseudenhygromyxa sp. WMMC2535]NVB39378.1 hypothetical protein [Pseudenhygromyxa sp. WMMC2535]